MALMVGFSVGGLAAGEVALNVMSFNVRYGTAMDGENSWPKRKDILVETIRQCAPDVLGVQECLAPQGEYIAKALPEYEWFGVGREADASGEMAAIFYRRDVLEPVEKGHFWLSLNPDEPGSRSWGSSCTRMVSWARFKHLKSGVLFQYYNTHFDHRSEEARCESALLLVDRTHDLPESLPVIITGDFNCPAEDCQAWRTFTTNKFKDAWVEAGKKVGPEVTFGNFGPPSDAKKSRIDWILFRGPIQVKETETVLFNRAGRYPSDHFPVLSKLVITN